MHAMQTLSATGNAAINTPYQLAIANPAYTGVSGAWNWVFSGLSGGAARGSVTQVPTAWAFGRLQMSRVTPPHSAIHVLACSRFRGPMDA